MPDERGLHASDRRRRREELRRRLAAEGFTRPGATDAGDDEATTDARVRGRLLAQHGEGMLTWSFRLPDSAKHDNRLHDAVISAVRRQPVLHTAIMLEADGSVSRRILDPAEVWRATADEPDSAEALARVPIDPAHQPPLRARLLPDGEDDDALLVLSTHHCAADEATWAQLLYDVSSAYAGEPPEPPLDCRADVPVEVVVGAARRRANLLTEVIGNRPDPFRASRSKGKPRSGRVHLPVDARWLAMLAERAEREAVTRNDLLVAAAANVLGRRGGGPQPIIGVPVDIRPLIPAAPDGIAGDRISVVPIPIPISRGTVGASRAIADAVGDSAAGLDDVMRLLPRSTGDDRHPLLDVIVADRAAGRQLTLAGQRLPGEFHHPGASAFDLVLALEEDPRSEPGQEALLTAEFRESTMGPALARQILREWSMILLGDAPDFEPIPRRRGGDAVDVITAVHRHAADTPAAIAVTDGASTMTYATVLEEATALAGWLTAHTDPGDTVAVSLQRSARIPVALLACLRAHLPFVLVDPAHPTERRTRILQGADPALCIDDALLNDLEWPPTEDALGDYVHPGPEYPAYLVFTSGTTGAPKGVSIPRRGLDAVLGALNEMLPLTTGDVYLAGSTIGFDIAIAENLLPLTAGATAHIAGPSFSSDPVAAAEELRRIRPQCVEATPSLWDEIIKADPGSAYGIIACSGGEALSSGTATRLSEIAASTWNLYGPSETAIVATAHPITTPGTPPIGAPLPGVGAEILDPALRSTPPGAEGELYLSGPHLAHGYLGDPALTATKFIAAAGGGRRYRTGDLVSADLDTLSYPTSIRYHGRADEQLSIRGLRIETGEIESALSDTPGVEAAIVTVAQHRTAPILVCHYLASAPGGEVEKALRRRATQTLPPAARPALFQWLPEVPRTPNGKLDRDRLPAPEFPSDEEQEPATAIERIVVDAAQDLLDLADAPAPTADFRALGGHSLLAHRLALRIADELGAPVPLRAVLEAGTLREIADACPEPTAPIPGPRGSAVTPTPEYPDPTTPTPVPPLPGQHRILTAEAIAGAGSYTIPVLLHLVGPVERARLERALEAIITAHPVLRTRPTLEAGRVRVILDPPKAPAHRVRIPERETVITERNRVIAELLREPFPAIEGPFRVTLLRHPDGTTTMVWLIHHAHADEWSLGPLFRDLKEAYANRPVPPFPLSHRELLNCATVEGESDRQYWQAHKHLLAPATATLPGERRSPGRGPDIHLTVGLEPTCLHLLRESPHAADIVRAAVLLLLHRTGADPVVGMPVAGRYHPGLTDAVGYFGNTLPVGVPEITDAGCRVEELLERIHAAVFDAAEHGTIPLEELIPDGTPFRVLVDHRPRAMPAPDIPEWGATPIPPPVVAAKTPVTVLHSTAGETVRVDLLFDGSRFDESGARVFHDLLVSAIKGLAESGGSVGDIDLGAPPKPAPNGPDTPLPDILSTALRAHAEDIVLTGSDESFTGRQLLGRVAAIASALPADTTDTVVGIHAHRRIDQILAILACWWAGCGFTVLRTEDPPERQARMVDSADARMVLADAGPTSLPEGITVIRIPEGLAEPDPGDPVHPHPDSVAYVVFTSGTTGTPKGVRVPHRAAAGLMGLVRALAPADDLRPRLVSVAPMHFDVGLLEIVATLSHGGHLHVPEDVDRVGPRLVQTVRDHRATHLAVTPTVLAGLGDPASLPEDVVILVGAEQMPANLARDWSARHRVINLYGPTEATVNSTHGEALVDADTGRVTVGHPDPGMCALILDSALRPLPEGVPGELWLHGDGIADGYLGDSARTASSFVAAPGYLGAAPGTRMYRTGDRALRRHDGALVCLGRVDDQLKIRGLRIEPGDVESGLLRIPGIQAAAVVEFEGHRSAPALGAVVVTDSADPTAADPASLRDAAGRVLPPQLLPQRIQVVPQLPLTENGKTDRTAVRSILEGAGDPGTTGVPEGRPLDPDPDALILCTAVGELLDLPAQEVDLQRSFLDLGGDSILALQLAGRLGELGLDHDPATILDTPSLSQLLHTDAKSPGTPAPGMDRSEIPAEGTWPPLRVAAEHMALAPTTMFAQTMVLTCPDDGADHLVDALVPLHPGLRTAYRSAPEAKDAPGSNAEQYLMETLAESPPAHLPAIRVDDEEAASRISELRDRLARMLDPGCGRLVASAEVSTGEGRLLVLVIHHIGVDLVSWSRLLRDLRSLAAGLHPTPPIMSPREISLASHPVPDPEVPLEPVARIADGPLTGMDTAETAEVAEHVLDPGLSVTLIAQHGSGADLGGRIRTAIASAIRSLDRWGPHAVRIDVEEHGRDGLVGPEVVGWWTRVSSEVHRADGIYSEPPAEAPIPPEYRSDVIHNHLGAGPGSGGDERGLFQPARITGLDPIRTLADPGVPLRNAVTVTSTVVGNQIRLTAISAGRVISQGTGQRLLELVEAVLTAQAGPGAPTARAGADRRLPLTPTQEGLLHLQEGGSPAIQAYQVTMELTLIGDLDAEALAGAWRKLHIRHPMLSCTFHRDTEGRPYAVPGSPGEALVQLPGESEALPEPDATFDPGSGPLARMRIIPEGGRCTRLIIELHHLLADGWSAPIIARDLFTLLGTEGDPEPVDPLPALAAAAATPPPGDRWRNILRSAVPTELRTGGTDSGRRREAVLDLTEDVTRNLLATARAHGLTSAALLHGIWALVLARHTGQSSVTMGSVVSGRPRKTPGADDVVGLFASTIPVPVSGLDHTRIADADPEMILQAAVDAGRRAKRPLLEATEHTPDLAALQVLAGTAGAELFDSLLVIENYPLDETALLHPAPGVTVSSMSYQDGTHYPVTVIINPGDRLRVRVAMAEGPVYRGRLTAERLLGEFLHLCRMTAGSPRIHDHGGAPPMRGPMPLLGSGRSEIMVNGAEARRMRCSIAAELDSVGVLPGDIVAIAAPRGLEQVSAVWGTWLAGAVPMPVEIAPDGCPTPLAQDILRDVGPRVILDSRRLRAILTAPPRDFRPTDRARALTDDDPAYLVHTSGTTGIPKGVLVPWAVLERLMAHQRDTELIPDAAVIAHFAPDRFDVTMQELATALTGNNQLVVIGEDARRDVGILAERLDTGGVDVLFATSLVLNALAGCHRCTGAPHLKALVQAGEPLRASAALRDWCSATGPALTNHYGPSETHVCVAATIPAPDESSPIGFPLAATPAEILDRHLAPVADGETGELYVGGPMAHGYLGDPALTAIRFVAAPGGLRRHRTGDLCRKDGAGMLHCLGRSDEQVKINGVRVLPGETAALASGLPGVADTAAVGLPDGLHLAVVPHRDATVAAEEIQRAILDHVGGPEAPATARAGVPVEVRILPSLPMTGNGKTDIGELRHLFEDDTESLEPESRTPSVPDNETAEDLHSRIIGAVMADVLSEDGEPRMPLGPGDSFLKAGGHSLAATRVALRLAEALGTDIPVRLILEGQTPRAVARGITKADKPNHGPAEIGEWTPPAGSPLPATPAQRRFWALSLLNPEDATYRLPLLARFTREGGATEGVAKMADPKPMLEEGLRALIRKHEALRTIIVEGEDGPVQFVYPADAAAAEFAVTQCRDHAELLEQHNRPIPLDRGLPIHCTIAPADEGSWLMSLVIHHAACDGWSLPILFADLEAHWSGTFDGTPPPSPGLLLHSRESKEEHSGATAAAAQYWRSQLDGIPCPMPLPVDRTRARRDPEMAPRGKLYAERVTPHEERALGELARRLGATPFMVLHALIAATLGRLGCGDDIVVATPESGRAGLDSRDVVGCFVNLLVLRVSLSGNPTFRELVSRTRATGLDAAQHANMPFDRLVGELTATGSGDHHPLATVGIGIQAPLPDIPEPPGWQVATVEQDLSAARFDINIDFAYAGRTRPAGFAVEYDSDLFDEATIRDLVTRIRRILGAVTANPELRYRELPVLLDAERRAASVQPRTSRCPGEPALSLVRGMPTGGRLLGPTGEIPTSGIIQRVTELAERLRNHGAGIGDFVAIRVNRGADLVISLLAVLRCGAAYVPIPPETPEGRARQILTSTGASLVIDTGSDGKTRIRPAPGSVSRSADERAPLPDPGSIPPDSPAYVLYTSGSTGTPKGVLIQRSALAATLEGIQEYVGFTSETVFLEVSSFAFDTSTWGLLAPLYADAGLVVAEEAERRDPAVILSRIRQHGVTASEATPGWWSLLAEAAGPDGLSGITALSAGEELPASVVEALCLAGADPWNLYGPTEAAVFATCGHCSSGDPDIGVPLPGIGAMVLDDGLHPVPDNALGELHLSGLQLALGYLGQPDLTSAAFVADPATPGHRLYRTGDLVRRRRDGRLSYVGRRDDQLQVRGHRIEPAEITSALLRLTAVREAVVRVLVRGEARTLVGYVTGPAQESDPTTLLGPLREMLPDYMVPHRLVILHQLPRTPNGKVDLHALPEPEVTRAAPPVDATERLIADLLMEILDIPEPSRHDDLISLGGDSISAIRLATRATDRGLPLTVRDVLEAGSIAELAVAARHAGTDGDAPDPTPEQDDDGDLSGLDATQLGTLLEDFLVDDDAADT